MAKESSRQQKQQQQQQQHQQQQEEIISAAETAGVKLDRGESGGVKVSEQPPSAKNTAQDDKALKVIIITDNDYCIVLRN